MVTLIQKIEDIESKLRISEGEVVDLQAEIAVKESQSDSVKKLLAKTSQALEEEQKVSQDHYIELQNYSQDNLKLKKKLEEKEKELSNALDQISEFLSKPNLPADPFLQNWMIIKDSQLQTTRQMLEDWAIVARLIVEQISLHFSCWERLVPSFTKKITFPKIDYDDILNIDQESFPQDFGALIAYEEILMKSLYDKIVNLSQLNLESVVSEIEKSYESLKKESKTKITFKKYNILTKLSNRKCCIILAHSWGHGLDCVQCFGSILFFRL